LYRDVQQHLVQVQYYGDRPLKILDLGCGSALHFAQALKGRELAYYRGYDLSENAIAEAAQNLATLKGTLDLRQGELLAGLQETSKTFDLIFSSLALHHLSTAEKAEFFQLSFKNLTNGGILLLIDVMREEDQSRDQYLNQHLSWIQSTWTTSSLAGKQAIAVHIRNHDFPENVSTIQFLAQQAGFFAMTKVSRYLWHYTYSFEKRQER